MGTEEQRPAVSAPGPGRTADLRETLIEGAPLFAMVPLWIWWACWKGGYPPSVFLPAIGYLALSAIALSIAFPRAPVSGARLVALTALAALTAWSIGSLVWADDRGGAEIEAARQVLLFGSFALPVLWPVSRRALVWALAMIPIVALCGAVSALLAALANPAGLIDGRLTDPTGYPNASAALFAVGALVASILAARPEPRDLIRAVALATAGALAGACLLSQSRGALLASAVTLVVAFLLLPDRRRFLVVLVILGVGLLPAIHPLLDVHSVAVEGGDLAAAIRHAVRLLTFDCFGLLVVGWLYAWADRRIEVPGNVSRGISLTLAIVVGVAFLGGIGAIVVTGSDVGHWVSDEVESFKTPDYGRLEAEPSRFTAGLGSNRFDYWRAAADIFAEEPITGVGVGNFLAPYLEKRHANKATVYPHNLWMGALAELGAVGLALLFAFLVALGAALLAAARQAAPRSRWIVVGASLPLVYVLIHGSFDWITVFPVVAAPPLALAGADSSTAWSSEPAGSRWISLAVTGGIAMCALLVVPLLLAAGLSERGFATWEDRPVGAVDDLRRAAGLDPLSAAPDVRLGVVEVELGNYEAAREAFQGALRRDGSQWYPRLQLGLLAARAGDRGVGIDELRRARELNPREAVIGATLRKIEAGETPSPRSVQRTVLDGDNKQWGTLLNYPSNSIPPP